MRMQKKRVTPQASLHSASERNKVAHAANGGLRLRRVPAFFKLEFADLQ